MRRYNGILWKVKEIEVTIENCADILTVQNAMHSSEVAKTILKVIESIAASEPKNIVKRTKVENRKSIEQEVVKLTLLVNSS
jgi:chorismate mutase